MLHRNWDSYPKDRTLLHEKGTLISLLDMGTGHFQESCSRGSPWWSQRPRLQAEEERKKSVWTSSYDLRGHHENPYWGDHLFFMSWFTVFRSWGTGPLSGLKLVNSCFSQEAPTAAGPQWSFCCHSCPRTQCLVGPVPCSDILCLSLQIHTSVLEVNRKNHRVGRNMWVAGGYILKFCFWSISIVYGDFFYAAK